MPSNVEIVVGFLIKDDVELVGAFLSTIRLAIGRVESSFDIKSRDLSFFKRFSSFSSVEIVRFNFSSII